jgi:cytochrome c-type biogenesis protein CcmH
MKKIIFFALSLLFFAAVASRAAEAPPAADDPALESRMMQLASQLRCLVCQNETIADSTADLASDLRNQIRVQMKRGETNQEIIDYMVARYGDFVLYKPPLKTTTLLLWAGPFVLLVVGLAALFYRLSRRPSAPPPQLTEAERARAAALLATNEAGEQG